MRLLQRSTRKLSLTEEGRLFYERCTGRLRELESAQAAVKDAGRSPAGRLRVTSVSPFGRTYVLPLLPAFSRHYLEIEVELHLDDAVSDMIAEGYDVGIRAGEIAESDHDRSRDRSTSFRGVWSAVIPRETWHTARASRDLGGPQLRAAAGADDTASQLAVRSEQDPRLASGSRQFFCQRPHHPRDGRHARTRLGACASPAGPTLPFDQAPWCRCCRYAYRNPHICSCTTRTANSCRCACAASSTSCSSGFEKS